MKSIRFWEELATNTMPSFDHLLYDGWLLRFTQGYSRHNNSVWPLYKGERPLADKIAFCEAQYAARGLICGFRLAELPEHKAIEAALSERGYGRSNPNLVTVCSSVAAPEATVTELDRDKWLETIYQIRPGDPKIQAWQRQVFQRLTLSARFAVVKHGDEMCGYGRSVQQGDVLNIDDLWLLPDYRGLGLGTQLIHGLLHLGHRDGATSACITVNEDNEGARRLYERLGFVNRYLYWYMVPPEEAD